TALGPVSWPPSRPLGDGVRFRRAPWTAALVGLGRRQRQDEGESRMDRTPGSPVASGGGTSYRDAAPLFFGWRVVWAAFTIAVLAWGIGFYGPSIFLQ